MDNGLVLSPQAIWCLLPFIKLLINQTHTKMSKDQTKKKSDSNGISTLEIPFSAKEKKELQAILAKPHWGRRKMKDEFIAANGRLSEEVDAYMIANGKRKKKGIEDSLGSISEPKPKPTAKVRGGEPLPKRSGQPSELRFPFTGLRIEGTVLIIEYER